MKPSRAIIWTTAVGILLVGLGYALTRPAPGAAENIGNDRLRELVTGGARLVDVRSPGEFAMGHIAGAELVPPERVAEAARDWDRDQDIVLYCATGARSSTAMEQLRRMGFRRLYNHERGISGWDGELTTDTAQRGAGAIETDGLPVLVEFTSDG
ncbi:MAG: rhodanese-like domain-containing protein [Coriobacteriia bacterium]|nr:rhodanese-like domain-containing protein [Coriobacteriia bacterium]